MYEAEHENIKKYLNSVYTGVSAHIITIKEDMSHVYEINKVFENHEFLCLHGDRFLENTRTININFMGQNALFPAGPFFLALKYNIPVSYVFAMKERKFHYHFYATPPQLYFQEKLNLKKREASLMVIMKNYVNTLENILQKYPEQWFNYYYFWKENGL
jgi:predicted LPLAT superfamily acyltransferase